jgi:ribosome-binding protein aMBF1 (putative translation factor)
MAKRDPLLLAFGRCVRRHREGRGWSQEKLAERADVNVLNQNILTHRP